MVCSLLFLRQATIEWKGPFTITRVLGSVNYEVRCDPRPYRLKTLHVNHLKKWHAPDEAVSAVAWSDIQPSPLLNGDLTWRPRETKQSPQDPPPFDADLTKPQQRDLQDILNQHKGLFSQTPGLTKEVSHVIDTPVGQVVRTTYCPIP